MFVVSSYINIGWIHSSSIYTIQLFNFELVIEQLVGNNVFLKLVVILATLLLL